MIDLLCKRGYALFGRFVHKHRDWFKDLALDLHRALLPYSVEEYAAGGILLTILTFLSLFVVLLVVSGFSPSAILYTLPLSILIAAFITLFYFNYPSYRATRRGKDIDARLPAAVTHMSTLAGTGIAPINIFKTLASLPEYGEVSKECALIVRDVELFGKDLLTALSDSARRSPSRKWEELLWGVISALRSGGSLRDYFLIKVRDLMREFEKMEKEAMESAQVITEIYLIIAILGPILAVLMGAVVGIFGGGGPISPKTLILWLVYFGIPLIGFAFLMVARAIRPREIV